MIEMAALWLFWSAFIITAYTYLGFPMLVLIRGWFLHRPVKNGPEIPMVSMIIAAHNEAQIIKEKLDNTLALDWPRAQLEIIVASDGSDDGTNELVSGYNAAEVRLLILPRQGKNRTVNEIGRAHV